MTQPAEKFNASLKLALDYIARHPGRHIFPIAAGKKFPPCVRDNLDGNASNNPMKIKQWAAKWPGCNWGVAHRKSGLLVVDVDCSVKKGKQGQKTFDGIALAYDWPDTEQTTTPSGGFHLIYEGWADERHAAHIMALGDNGLGLDIDSPNYTLIPGCVFDDGTSYAGNGADAVRCPEWIYDVILTAKQRKRTTLGAAAGEVVVDLDQQPNIDTAIDFLQNDAEPAIEGKGGDGCTFRAAAYLKDLGISVQRGAELMNEYYNPRCIPPWDLSDLLKKMESAYSYGSLSKVGGKTAEADFADDLVEPFEPMGDPEKIAADAKLRQVGAQKNRESFGLDIVNGADIKMRTIDWVWQDHLALGQHTAIAGVQGDGKSQLVYALAAAVTTGGEWPGTNERAPQGRVILLNAEDTADEVMKPRLLAAGADMRFVEIVQGVTDKNGRKRKFNLQADLERLTKIAERFSDVKLITFDPVSSYLGSDLDSHSNTELRDALDPITTMAWKTGAAVVSVTHFNKSAKGVSALNRVMGGAGFTAAPRTAFAVIRDAKNPLTRLMLPLKSNLAAEGAIYGMEFTLKAKVVGTDERNKKEISAPYVTWGAKTTVTADEALAANNAKLRGPSKLDEAISFLKRMLAPGPKLTREVEAAAAKADIAKETLRRAREELGVISEKRKQRDGRGPWELSLPDPEAVGPGDDEADFGYADAQDDFAVPFPLDPADPLADLM